MRLFLRLTWQLRHLALCIALAAAMSLIASFVRAEYRAYELSVENLETGKSRTVTTTLDHWQYSQYYPLQPGEAVRYVDSWMCWENTGNRPICKRAPSSTGQ